MTATVKMPRYIPAMPELSPADLPYFLAYAVTKKPSPTRKAGRAVCTCQGSTYTLLALDTDRRTHVTGARQGFQYEITESTGFVFQSWRVSTLDEAKWFLAVLIAGSHPFPLPSYNPADRFADLFDFDLLTPQQHDRLVKMTARRDELIAILEGDNQRTHPDTIRKMTGQLVKLDRDIADLKAAG